jgi:hypothetical protein
MLIVGSNHYVAWDGLKGEDSKERVSKDQASVKSASDAWGEGPRVW